MFINQQSQQMPYNYNYSYNPNMFSAVGYAMPQMRKGTNALTLEQQQELQQKAGGLNLMPTKEEYYQAICTHRDIKSGYNVTIEDESGNLTCPICSSQFRSLNMTDKDVEEAVSTIVDILENTKMLYLDIPPEVCQEFMKILPMVKKIPALYKIAAANFRQYENIPTSVQNGPSSLISQYNYVNGPLGAQFSVPMPYMQQQPMMQQPQQAYMQQPGMMQSQQPYMMPYQTDMVNPTGFTQQQIDMTAGNPFYQQPQQPQFTNMNGQQHQCNCGNNHQQPTSNNQEQGQTVVVDKKFNV